MANSTGIARIEALLLRLALPFRITIGGWPAFFA
jgi:hypothetical protein